MGDPMIQIEELIKKHLPDAVVETTDLTGTRDHVGLSITSNAFSGKTLLQQHRMVMDILKEEFSKELHAVQIKTATFNPRHKETP